MRRKRARGRGHLISISFIVTFLALAGVYTAFYISVVVPHIDVEHLPQSIPAYKSFWASYVPANALQFGFQNFTKIRLLNSSYPPDNTLLQLAKPAGVIRAHEVNYLLDIAYAQPNASVDIAFLAPQSYLGFQGPLQAQAGYGEPYESAALYEVAFRSGSSTAVGWLALIPRDGAVAFSPGASEAKQAVELSLQSAANVTQSVLSRTDVTQSLYVLGGVGDQIGLGEQNFPGVVRSGLMTVTSVDSAGPYLYVKNVVVFANSSAAMAHYSDVKQGFPGAQKLVVYDSLVLAQEQDPFTDLGADYRLVL